jgi:hypothetical protein
MGCCAGFLQLGYNAAMKVVALILFATVLSGANVSFQCVPQELEAVGVTCTASHPCTVYLELASLEVVGGKVFLAGNLHTSEATLSSILLASDDAGTTWTEPHPRIRGAGLEQIQFIDYETGWIGGQTLQGRSHDPFLLITHDGGKTFQLKPILEEPRTGAIEKFWFESKNNGALLLDRIQATETGARHELYQSMTGGDNWSLVQVSVKPLQIKGEHAGDANPDWRLTPDGKTKSYHVEHRQGSTWRTVSDFPIEVTVCKDDESTLSAEPPPSEPEEQAKPAEEKKPVRSLKSGNKRKPAIP